MVLDVEAIDINRATRKGHTPLHLASMAGHPLIAQALLERNADVDVVDADGQSPLHKVLLLPLPLCMGEMMAVDVLGVCQLILHFVLFNAIVFVPPPCFFFCLFSLSLLLSKACAMGYQEVIEVLISTNANVDSKVCKSSCNRFVSPLWKAGCEEW